MADLPEIEWTDQEFTEWMKPAFEALEEQGDASDEETGQGGRPWEESRAEFLAALDVQESALVTVRLGVLDRFVRHVDEELSGDEEKRAFLRDENERNSAIRDYHAEWQQGLAWVKPEQQTQLNELWELRGDWHEWLPGQLTEWWPEWPDSTPGDLAPWLDSYLPSLFVSTDLAEEADVTTLAWVTPEQQTQLNELWELRGDWHEWLPGQLTEWWPEWQQSTPEDLAPWLDGYLPSLFLSTEVAEEASEATAEAAPEEIAQRSLDDLTGQVLQSKPELAGEISEEELRAFLAELVQECLAAGAA
jgi:hypothetical protein